MSNRIFRSICLVAVLVFLACAALTLGVVYRQTADKISAQLITSTQYVSAAIEASDDISPEIFKSEKNRITLIASDGTVLYDSRADVSKMENHADREEVIQAMQTGVGSSVRNSDTIMEKTIYYAIRLSDGTILRMSTSHYSIFSLLLEIATPAFFIIVLALMISALLASRAEENILKPINALDLDHPENNKVYDELAPLLGKIAHQKEIIAQQLKQAHQKQEEFLQITENMNEGLLIFDRNTILLSCNSAALHLLGAGTAPEGSIYLLNRSRQFTDLVENALSGKADDCVMTLGQRTCQLIGSPTFEGKAIIGGVILILDITEINERERLRREFTANVSHELKTPLTSISGFAELINSGALPPGDVLEFSKIIYDEAQRLITLVNDIIKLSRLDEAGTPLERESVDLYALSAECMGLMQANAQQKNVALNLSGSSAKVYGVRTVISEMIFNLCDNAIKYNKDGGSVDVEVSSEDSSSIITVRDTGIGIPPEHIDRIFERFYRVDKSHSKEIGGTGLGLSIVKHGAIYHDAKVSLTSTPGSGTCVKIEFPAE